MKWVILRPCYQLNRVLFQVNKYYHDPQIKNNFEETVAMILADNKLSIPQEWRMIHNYVIFMVILF